MGRLDRRESTQVAVASGDAFLDGDLTIPAGARGLVLFAHGSGSSRQSPRNRWVAQLLNDAAFGTLLVDLLTPAEEQIDRSTAQHRFDIDLLARRLIGAVDWLGADVPASLPIGLFGASTGAAAALVAASERADAVHAVVSRGGRPDLAGPALARVHAPTLLIVGGLDAQVLELNRQALHLLDAEEKELVVVSGATHLFEEPRALEQVARLAADWFTRHLASRADSRGSDTPRDRREFTSAS
jgi:dienelactone hydrolase